MSRSRSNCATALMTFMVIFPAELVRSTPPRAIRYFAGSVLRSDIFQMQRRDRNDGYIHAAAFVAHQFYRCQDNMIDLWLSVMASFRSAAARDYQETLVQERKDQQGQTEIVFDGLETSVFGVLRDIRSVMSAANLSNGE